MKQLFQIIRGILLAFVLFEVLIFAGYKMPIIGEPLGNHPIFFGVVVLSICLYITFVRKGMSKASFDRQEYLVTMEPGAYGRIGGIFDKTRYGQLERLSGGWLEGVNTYRAENGTLLFTVRRGGSMPVPGRLICAVAVMIVLIGPLSAVSFVDTLNLNVGNALAQIGLTRHPTAMAYLDVPPVELPWFTTDATTEETEEPQEVPQEEQPVEDSTGDFGDTVSGWFTGVSDWVADLLEGSDYLLPSHRRLLTDKDVAGMDAAQIQRAINEMYARHGYDLSISADADYFAAQDWYEPDSSLSSDDVRAEFSDIEEQNLTFLINCRNKLQ